MGTKPVTIWKFNLNNVPWQRPEANVLN